MSEPTTETCARCEGQYLSIPPDYEGDPMTVSFSVSRLCVCTQPASPEGMRRRAAERQTTTTMKIPAVSMRDLERTSCGAVLATGDLIEHRERSCTNQAIGTTEAGVRVCASCAEAFEHHGFRVDRDSEAA